LSTLIATTSTITTNTITNRNIIRPIRLPPPDLPYDPPDEVIGAEGLEVDSPLELELLLEWELPLLVVPPTLPLLDLPLEPE
jgi:hypothetical protein